MRCGVERLFANNASLFNEYFKLSSEKEWWWAQGSGGEGYVPRNLVGMWPRIKSKEDHD